MDSSDERLQEGIAAYKRGQTEEAGRLIKMALHLNPKNERAWLWLSGVVTSDEKRRTCLEWVLAINPDNQIAQKGLLKLSAENAQEKRPLPPTQPAAETAAPPSPQPTPAPEPLAEPLTVFPPEEPAAAEPVPPIKAAKEAREKGRRWSKILIPLVIILILVGGAAAAYYFNLNQNSWLFEFGSSSQVIAQPATAEEKKAVLDAVFENIAAGNVENIDRYMASIHSQSEDYQLTRDLLEDLYRDYDLTATLRSVELISYTPEEAQVSFVLETRKREGPDFRNNVINGTFILRPENGQWKLYDQNVRHIDYLN